MREGGKQKVYTAFVNGTGCGNHRNRIRPMKRKIVDKSSLFPYNEREEA
jgi:hypothetical protein